MLSFNNYSSICFTAPAPPNNEGAAHYGRSVLNNEWEGFFVDRRNFGTKGGVNSWLSLGLCHNLVALRALKGVAQITSFRRTEILLPFHLRTHAGKSCQFSFHLSIYTMPSLGIIGKQWDPCQFLYPSQWKHLLTRALLRHRTMIHTYITMLGNTTGIVRISIRFSLKNEELRQCFHVELGFVSLFPYYGIIIIIIVIYLSFYPYLLSIS